MQPNSHMQPKLAELALPQMDNLKAVDLLVQGFELRLEAEEAYEKALARVAIKFASPTFKPSDKCYSALVNEMSRIHSQRSFQVSHFRGQMKEDVLRLKKVSKEIATELENRIKEYRKVEKDLRLNSQKLDRSRQNLQQSLKQLDQKVILNEIGKINRQLTQQARKRHHDTTNKLLAQQREMMAGYHSAIDTFKSSILGFNQSLPQTQTQLTEIIMKLRGQFFDIMKKYTIHEVSLVRNIQYDLDNTIRRIEKEEENPGRQCQYDPLPPYVEPKQEDSWESVRMKILVGKPEIEEVQQNNEDIKELFVKGTTGSTEDYELLIDEIRKNFKVMRQHLWKFLQGYRLSNKFKFEDAQYKRLQALFQETMQLAYQLKDFETLQKMLLFSITYYKQDKPNQKRFLFQSIKLFKFFCNIQFWRFYTYFSLKTVIENYRKNAVQNAAQNILHEKNSVYSTILTIANTMIQFGLQKQSIKNFTVKAAKVYPLNQQQITEILKFVQNQSAQYEIKKAKEMQNVQSPTKVLKLGKQ